MSFCRLIFWHLGVVFPNLFPISSRPVSLSVCCVKLSCLPLCLPACLSFCLPGWLAGWLSDCPQCCLSVWQAWQLFFPFSLRLIHYNVLLSQHILSNASHRNRTIWREFIRQRSSILAISRWRWCLSHPLTAKGQCTEYNTYACYFNILPLFVMYMLSSQSLFFPFSIFYIFNILMLGRLNYLFACLSEKYECTWFI